MQWDSELQKLPGENVHSSFVVSAERRETSYEQFQRSICRLSRSIQVVSVAPLSLSSLDFYLLVSKDQDMLGTGKLCCGVCSLLLPTEL